MKVLVVEDEPQMALLLGRSLGALGYAVDIAETIADAREAVALAEYGLVLLDRRLPDGDGMTLVRSMRQGRDATPVIILSALDEVPERVSGLDAGADDYLVKPFDTDELHARIRAAIRRPGGETPPPLACGRLTFDVAHRQVSVGGEPLLLNRRELAVLAELFMRAGRVVQRERLIEQVYGYDEEVNSNTLDAHVSRLRNRLSALDAGVVIHPVRGVGYLLSDVD
jgi:DNA-binding response OmpR family regulator